MIEITCDTDYHLDFLETFIDLCEEGTNPIMVSSNRKLHRLDILVRITPEAYEYLITNFKGRHKLHGTYAYDVEVLPNFFSVIAINVNDIKERFTFYIHDSHTDEKQIHNFFRNPLTLVSYNGLHYDDIIMRGVLCKFGFDELYDLSQRIINERNYSYDEKQKLRDFKYNIQVMFKSIDLMAIYNFQRFGVSLKHIGVVIGHETLQEFPIDFRANIKEDEIAEFLRYNETDVEITVKLYHRSKDAIELRTLTREMFGVNVMNKSDSQIGVAILKKFYKEAVGQNEGARRLEGRTHRGSVDIGDCIPKNLNFVSPEFKLLVEELSNTVVHMNSKGKFTFKDASFKNKIDKHYVTGESSKLKVKYGNTVYKVALGGIHSDDSEGLYKTTSNNRIVDQDVASYYPNLILALEIFPEHLGIEVLHVFAEVLALRLDYKSKVKTVETDSYEYKVFNSANTSLKEALNSVFGNFNSQHSSFYDPLAAFRVTIAGQLYLLDCIEKLELAGIPVISANTDGFTVELSKDKEAIYYEILDEWQARTSMELEETIYGTYARRDVNNYITEIVDPNLNPIELKAKGIFSDKEDEYRKGHSNPIVSTALKEYFINGVKPEVTIGNCDNIHKFLSSQRVNKKFELHHVSLNKSEQLPNISRYYVSSIKTGGVLKKILIEDKKNVTSILAGTPVNVVNYITEDSTDHYPDLHHQWYVNQTYKIIHRIESLQLSLF